MTDAFIQLSSEGTGKKVDNEAVTVAGSSVYRQRVQVSGVAPTDLAPVTSSGGLAVNVTGGVLSGGTLASLTSGTVFQGTSPWVILASTSGGAQPVVQSATPWVVVSSTTGGAIPVATHAVTQGTSPWVTQAATSGGAQPVVQSSTPWPVVASTTGGSVPVSLQNTLPLSVVASTTGGSIPVATHAVTQGTSPWVTQAATSGGAQPVAQSSTPWVVVASTTGGNQPVSVSSIASLTSGTVFQGTSPWVVLASTSGGNAPVIATQAGAPWSVVASTTGGAQPVAQSVTPWSVVSSTTGGAVPGLAIGIAKSAQPTSVADGTTASLTVDTKGRQVVTITQVRQLITQKYLQVVATGETVLLAGTSGTYHDLVSLCISSATSNIVGASCVIKDSSGGATQFRLNLQAGGSGGGATPIFLLFEPPWKHSTATSTGSAWTVNFSIAGTYDISAQFSDWTS